MRRRALALASLLLLLPAGAKGQACTGRFVNPLTDVCWECLFPLSIGPVSFGSAAGAPDTPNPGGMLCLCGSPIPRVRNPVKVIIHSTLKVIADSTVSGHWSERSDAGDGFMSRGDQFG